MSSLDIIVPKVADLIADWLDEPSYTKASLEGLSGLGAAIAVLAADVVAKDAADRGWRGVDRERLAAALRPSFERVRRHGDRSWQADTDYGPRGVLLTVSQKLGIPLGLWPQKTSMHVDLVFQTISVWRGRGSRPEVYAYREGAWTKEGPRDGEDDDHDRA